MPLAFLVLAVSVTRNTADPDLFGYLSFGRLFFQSDGFPYTDVFSYYPVKPTWIYHEWLSGVVFYSLFHFLGTAPLQVLKYAMAVGAVWLATTTAMRSGANKAAAAVCIFSASSLFALGYNPVRAQIFTYFFFSLTLLALEEGRKDGREKALWLLGPMYCLWGNLHGGFPAGLGMIFLYCAGHAAAGQKRRALNRAALLLLCFCATAINPYGFSYWGYVFESVLMPRPYIIEWFSLIKTIRLGFYLPASIIFILTASASGLSIGKLNKNSPFPMLVLGATAVMGFLHHRHVVFFAIAFFMFMPPVVSSLFLSGKTRRPLKIGVSGLLAAAIAMNLIICSLQAGWATAGNPFIIRASSNPDEAPNYPQGAVLYIKSKDYRANVVTEFHWGEYLMLHLYPENKIAVDGRYETVFAPETVEEHFLAFENPNVTEEAFKAYMDKYPHGLAVVSIGSRAEELLYALPEWDLGGKDGICSVFQHKDRERFIPLPAGE